MARFASLLVLLLPLVARTQNYTQEEIENAQKRMDEMAGDLMWPFILLILFTLVALGYMLYKRIKSKS